MPYLPRLTFAACFAALLQLAGCATPPPQGAGGGADSSVIATCNARREAIYARQNRADIYTDRTTQDRFSPQSGGYVSNNMGGGLGTQFGRDSDYNACVRSRGTTYGTP
jgi:hypothetical protein